MTALVLRGDARSLPLPNDSVDLIVTSPPFFGLRSYTDGGESYAGQIGSEYTPWQYLDALWACTAEWMRVLKPAGSLFVNLGDKYSTYTGANWGNGRSLDGYRGQVKVPAGGPVNAPEVYGIPYKSLMMLPHRYAIGCIDDLGLILRAEVIWSKPSAMPESAKDRVRRSHEQVFHFTKSGRYYAAIDEIRVPPSGYSRAHRAVRATPSGQRPRAMADVVNPLGGLPGSVWEIAYQPLSVPGSLGVDHWAAFPMDLPSRIIRAWSPPAICTRCSEGRRPVMSATRTLDGAVVGGSWQTEKFGHAIGPQGVGHWRYQTERQLLGYACACTPFSDHPERRGRDFHQKDVRGERGTNDGNGGERSRRYLDELANPRGPVREYDFDAWQPGETRPALVVDPFGGTGTTALVADVLGRNAISIDRSADYCRLATWRVNDPGERARALGVPKPPPVPDGQLELFGEAVSS